MASKRSQIAMTEDEVRAYLESERVLNVATIGPTGHPHVVAMWYAMSTASVFWTFGKSQKIAQPATRPEDDGSGRERRHLRSAAGRRAAWHGSHHR